MLVAGEEREGGRKEGEEGQGEEEWRVKEAEEEEGERKNGGMGGAERYSQLLKVALASNFHPARHAGATVPLLFTVVTKPTMAATVPMPSHCCSLCTRWCQEQQCIPLTCTVSVLPRTLISTPDGK